jgi:hypothetical protein
MKVSQRQFDIQGMGGVAAGHGSAVHDRRNRDV